MYGAVRPSQIPLESLGLEGAQYHTRLNLDSTKHPLSSADASLAASEVSSPQLRLKQQRQSDASKGFPDAAF